MKRLLLILGMVAAAAVTSLPVSAQRKTDTLGRGLVAMKKSGGIFLSWRITAEEYYDVTYNVYRDGTLLNAEPLDVSNYTDKSGTLTSTYTVCPVVRGVEGEPCEAVEVWKQNYKEITLPTVIGKDGTDITSQYQPNDISVADLDGDGEMELIVRRINVTDQASVWDVSQKDYTRIDIIEQDGTLLWWIDIGPNMFSPNQMESNAVAFDWDEDGKAEILMRANDGLTIHAADGTETVIGSKTANYRGSIAWHEPNNSYETQGTEYLLYMEGATGNIYQKMSYPLPRSLQGLIKGTTNGSWGDNYGHRANKHFFGAPYLDGQHPSILICRGIYTHIYMKAFDVNPTTHKLTQRWYWKEESSSSPWFGQGFHNFSINDVDMDGRDEIVYGSMVIDDNGKGLSTTGRGHGDAQHTSDLDPFRWGEEIFTCHEDKPGSMLRNATTADVYFTCSSDRDDGRCMAGNFSNTYPGCLMSSARTNGYISSVTGQTAMASDGTMTQNFRIYWDGDLQEETFNYGQMSEDGYDHGLNPHVVKLGSNWSNSGYWAFGNNVWTCNSTKGSPNFQGDIFGDWREELILRTSDHKLRIYTTTEVTRFRNYTLWHDHDYRNAMCWQMCGYNQPPHVSYFLGQMEGITVAPPPLTLNGRAVVPDGSTVGLGDHLLIAEQKDASFVVEDGASPNILTVNTPSWTQGTGNNANIKTTTYTHTLTGGAFTGAMRLVKQGEGTLILPSVTETYTGKTDVWNGTLQFDGTMEGSDVWMNRHTTLISGGTFKKSLRMEYNATMQIAGSISVDSLSLGIGSRVIFDINEQSNDMLNVRALTIERKTWKQGPKYLAPVFEIRSSKGYVESGTYMLGSVMNLKGSIGNIIIEGVFDGNYALSVNEGQLLLTVEAEDFTTETMKGHPVGAGTYYIYNVATDTWLCAGNEWGTHAATNDVGLDLTLTKSSSGYTIATGIQNGTSDCLNENLYMDSSSSVWTFSRLSTDDTERYVYAIGSGGNYLAASESGAVETVTTRTDARAAWQLVTLQDRFTMLRNATDEAPVDATFLISGADFGRNDTRWQAWKGNPTIGAAETDTPEGHSNYCAEVRGKTFDVYQILTGLRNGDYVLSCQGFYTADYSGTSTARNACLYANDEEVPIMLIGTGGYAKPANSQSAACQAFTRGDYADNKVAITVTDGTLRLGVRSTTSTGKDWTCFDHFRLTYLGDPTWTGIQSLTPALSKREGAIYNLAGQKVNGKLPHGIYIINGRKFLIK
ncbi:MAG: autotransporter-associated beta strand repeat-containing protein [Bacteroidaceae bacterium]|nr:autotransporter-associated beta strand repeat-containing protein [Bacteroidaceae bacterium]